MEQSEVSESELVFFLKKEIKRLQAENTVLRLELGAQDAFNRDDRDEGFRLMHLCLELRKQIFDGKI